MPSIPGRAVSAASGSRAGEPVGAVRRRASSLALRCARPSPACSSGELGETGACSGRGCWSPDSAAGRQARRSSSSSSGRSGSSGRQALAAELTPAPKPPVTGARSRYESGTGRRWRIHGPHLHVRPLPPRSLPSCLLPLSCQRSPGCPCWPAALHAIRTVRKAFICASAPSSTSRRSTVSPHARHPDVRGCYVQYIQRRRFACSPARLLCPPSATSLPPHPGGDTPRVRAVCPLPQRAHDRRCHGLRKALPLRARSARVMCHRVCHKRRRAR